MPAITTYDQACAAMLLRGATQEELRQLANEAARRVGSQQESACLSCGCTLFEENDGDILCQHCGTPHGEATAEDDD